MHFNNTVYVVINNCPTMYPERTLVLVIEANGFNAEVFIYMYAPNTVISLSTLSFLTVP